MEGRARNFEEVLADFQARLPGAEYVAIDAELTGVDIEGEPDSFEEPAAARFRKLCCTADRYAIIQIGITLVSPVTGIEEEDAQDGCLECASYNIFAFPWMGPERGHCGPCFTCQASALRFNGQHSLDFNQWVNEGVPYVSREREARYLGGPDECTPEAAGLLRLWKELCAARLPLVVHCPLDIFFLLAAFERCPLPRDDPREFALLVRQCFREVYDTAHLHGALGRFRRLGLTKFYDDAKARHEQQELDGREVGPVSFQYEAATAARYESDVDRAHEAGYDSLVTAKLFAYLRALAPEQVRAGANRLYLHKSVEYLDLDLAGSGAPAGCCMHDPSQVELRVAVLHTPDDVETARLISSRGSRYLWMDARHLLVIVKRKPAATRAKLRPAEELAGTCGAAVTQWLSFEEWRASRAPGAAALATGSAAESRPVVAIGKGDCRWHAVSRRLPTAGFGGAVLLVLLNLVQLWLHWRLRGRKQ